MNDDEPVVYRGFTITTKLVTGRNQWPTDTSPRYIWQYTWREHGVTSIPIQCQSQRGYRSRKLAIGFAKDYINERMAAADIGDDDDRA